MLPLCHRGPSKCGNPPVCWCVNEIILCKNIATLPSFNEDDGNTAIFLSLINKGMKELATFRSWPILKMIVIINSKYL